MSGKTGGVPGWADGTVNAKEASAARATLATGAVCAAPPAVSACDAPPGGMPGEGIGGVGGAAPGPEMPGVADGMDALVKKAPPAPDTRADPLWLACRRALAGAGIEDAAAEAALLWKAVTGQDRYLLAPQAALPRAVADRLWALVCARAARWPLQYLLGRWPFLDLELQVAPGVLIPRQDTECVAEEAIALGRQLQAEGLLPPPAPDAALPKEAPAAPVGAAPSGASPDSPAPGGTPRCLDLCAGSGALALALAVHLRVGVTAVELSAAALPCLRANLATVCRQFAAPPVQLAQADVFTYQQRLADGSLALIVSNPPYLTAAELACLQPEVAHEPRLALDGGADGLRFYRHLATAYRRCLTPGGALVLEIGAAQADAVRALLADAAWRDIRLLRDYGGHDRVVTARR